jgi:hypothetical protein
MLIGVCKFWRNQIYETDIYLVFENIKKYYELYPNFDHFISKLMINHSNEWKFWKLRY